MTAKSGQNSSSITGQKHGINFDVMHAYSAVKVKCSVTKTSAKQRQITKKYAKRLYRTCRGIWYKSRHIVWIQQKHEIKLLMLTWTPDWLRRPRCCCCCQHAAVGTTYERRKQRQTHQRVNKGERKSKGWDLGKGRSSPKKLLEFFWQK